MEEESGEGVKAVGRRGRWRMRSSEEAMEEKRVEEEQEGGM